MNAVKFRSDEEIQHEADEFRASPLLIGHDVPPIDVIYVAEVLLKLDVIPVRDLFAQQHIDAALLPSLSGIHIDEDAYLSWESGRGWVEKRLRFSFAHELGHYVLHGDTILASRFTSIADFRQWAGNRENYKSAEYQADEFAGRFLVPRPILDSEYDSFCGRADAANPEWRQIEGTREYLAKKIAPRFGVNPQVIETRLDREGIWPAE